MGIVEKAMSGAASGTTHPFDPLSADDIKTAVALVRAHCEVPASVRFVSVALKEPAKEAVLNGASGEIEREAFVLLLDNADAKTYEVVECARATLPEKAVLRKPRASNTSGGRFPQL